MKKVILILCSVLILVACGSKEENDNKGKVNISEEKSNNEKNNNPEDKKLESNQEDSNSELKYDEVTIGTQVWMSKNLDVSTYRNGDPIPQAKKNEEWQKAGENKQPAWCYYENDPKNGEKYGKLYNWYAVNDPRGLAPRGWHIPSDDEWTVLTAYLGGEYLAGAKMKSTSGWEIDGNGTNGTNTSGFSGLPGGNRNYSGGSVDAIGERGDWWSSTESSTDSAWGRTLYYFFGDVARYDFNKQDGLSVRCLRD